VVAVAAILAQGHFDEGVQIVNVRHNCVVE
jgi:hypothetical protein